MAGNRLEVPPRWSRCGFHPTPSQDHGSRPPASACSRWPTGRRSQGASSWVFRIPPYRAPFPANHMSQPFLPPNEARNHPLHPLQNSGVWFPPAGGPTRGQPLIAGASVITPGRAQVVRHHSVVSCLRCARPYAPRVRNDNSHTNEDRGDASNHVAATGGPVQLAAPGADPRGEPWRIAGARTPAPSTSGPHVRSRDFLAVRLPSPSPNRRTKSLETIQ
jgi:hypothetical protein